MYSSESYRDGKYKAAGRWYPESDLFGYPDSLIRSRVNFAYQVGCDLLKKYNYETNTIADIGSCHGHGVNTIQTLLEPKQVLSLDRWYDFLFAQSRVIKPRPDLVTMNLPDIPLADESCDAVFLIHVIEHLPDLQAQLKEIKRIIKPNGALIVATPDKRNLVWHNPEDFTNFDSQSLTELLKEIEFNPQIYSIVGNKHAIAVHERKRIFARFFPVTQTLRKYVPWQLWDKFLLSAELSNKDFSLKDTSDPNGIDLFAFATKN
jgi:ubiquinone/menaquinone biosynthesis C-methylase UbiE